MEVGKMPAQRSTKQSTGLTAAGLIAVTAATLLMMAWAIFPTTAFATHVAPVQKTGNPTCGTLAPGTIELKVEPVADGTFSDGTLTVTIDVRDTPDGQVFDFTSNIGLDAVFAKGSNTGNLYTYDPPGPEAKADTGLHAPVNASGKFAGLSHISFCYDKDVTTTTATTTSSTTATTTSSTTATTTSSTTTTPGGGGGGGTTTTPPSLTTTTSPTVGPTTVQPSETETEAVAPTTVGPGKLAFTGLEDIVPIGALALTLMTTGSGLLWAGARRRRSTDAEDED
jgi:hypothetical protein